MSDIGLFETMAKQIAFHVSDGITSRYEGRWTISVYDTAWVSMIEDRDGNWLFPEAFNYILDSQETSGGWPGSGVDIDGILNTLAALLAIEKHSSVSSHLSKIEADSLQCRKISALAFLQSYLNSWDVESCMHVGFEVLVPSLLSMLSEYELDLDFPGREALMNLNQQKLRLFNPEMLYGPYQSTILHSLEAMIGRLDFSRLSHHLVGGSMLGSPSSTAAYLMNNETWDKESEAYLRDCIQNGGGYGRGGVPSAYPCEIFEFTWVLGTLIHAGFENVVLSDKHVSKALDVLHSRLQNGSGTLGFASGMLSDSDDTAKAIHILNFSSRSASPDQMLKHFLSPKGHMMTYIGERNPSPSANCNALLGILSTESVGKYWKHINSITSCLCDLWWDDALTDKWNLSRDYTWMLLVQALTTLLHQYNSGSLQELPSSFLRDRVVVVLIQVLNRYLFKQETKNSSDQRRLPESVAYETLACVALRSIPFQPNLLLELDQRIDEKRKYLLENMDTWRNDQYLWIEKTSYGSSILSEAYCLAAMYAQTKAWTWDTEVKNWFHLSNNSMEVAKFFGVLHGTDTPWKYQASVLEGVAFSPRLESIRTENFPIREGIQDRYMAYIPTAWTLINNLHGLNIPTTIIWDMMRFSLLDFLVDEYMESTVALLSQDQWRTLKEHIIKEFNPPDTVSESSHSGNNLPPTLATSDKLTLFDPDNSSRLSTVQSALNKYVKEVISHPRVQSASNYDLEHLKREIRYFLLAHIDQMEANTTLNAKRKANENSHAVIFAGGNWSFFQWARTTASNHISCPVSFAFYSCILAASRNKAPGEDCFTTPQQKYIASDLCAHLAVMSRLFNDYGSIHRDGVEGNLNSVNFPEFHPRQQLTGPHMEIEDLTSAKFPSPRASLLQLAEYERRASRAVMLQLLANIHTQELAGSHADQSLVYKGLKLFAYVTELFADMYVAKDLTNAAR